MIMSFQLLNISINTLKMSLFCSWFQHCFIQKILVPFAQNRGIEFLGSAILCRTDTSYQITQKGFKALAQYWENLDAVRQLGQSWSSCTFSCINLFSRRENFSKGTCKPSGRLFYLARHRLSELYLCRLNPDKVHINLNIPANHINK